MKKLASTIIAIGLGLASSAAFAGPLLDSSVAYERALRAETSQQQAKDCVPANGAQILGGFAASGDYVNVATGQICGR